MWLIFYFDNILLFLLVLLMLYLLHIDLRHTDHNEIGKDIAEYN